MGNVFSNGRGVDLSLDHHKKGPYKNLFNCIDLRTELEFGNLMVGMPG